MLTGGGLGLRLILARDTESLFGWAVAALFIPALALALGVCTKSRKPFEALYTAWWYIGPLHQLRNLDFIGTQPASSTPVLYLVASMAMLFVACFWRKARLSHARLTIPWTLLHETTFLCAFGKGEGIRNRIAGSKK
jgi:hypothetical protein